MSDCKSVVNPSKYADFTHPQDGSDPVPLSRAEYNQYRSIVGALLYAANTTRVDIAHIVGVLSRYVAAPAQHHLQAAKHCLRYLKGTLNYGMISNGKNSYSNSDHFITAYTDASWGNELTDRKSTTGTVVKYNGNV